MKKILLVEDDPETVMLFHVHLSGPDWALSVCSSGQDALEAAVKQYHELIILGHPLPDMKVGELCEVLTSRKVNSPILLLADDPWEGIALTAAACGADDWLQKPFALSAIRAKIRKLIRRSDDNQMALASCE